MFKLFKKTSAKDKLEKQYRKLLEEAHKLSTVDRTKSDAKMAEANAVLQQLDSLHSQ